MRGAGRAAGRITIWAMMIAIAAAGAALVDGPLAAAVSAAQSSSNGSAQQPSGSIRDLPLPLPRGAAGPVDKVGAAVQFLAPVQVTVPARRSAVVNLEFRVANGLHINSHAPRDKNLVPARLAVAEGGGIDVTRVDFPSGADYALAFSPRQKLSVYTGEFVLRAHLTAAPGRHALQAELRYQACDQNECRPPASLPIAVLVIAK